MLRNSSTAFGHAHVASSLKAVIGLLLSQNAIQSSDGLQKSTSLPQVVRVEAARLIVARHCLKERRLALPSSPGQPLAQQAELRPGERHRLALAEDFARSEHFLELQRQREASARAFRL